MTRFKLYPKETRTLLFKDYQLIMDEVKRAGAKTAFEIGPGYSTLALLEGGIEHVVTAEHDPKWLAEAFTRFEKFPQVKVVRYIDEPEARLKDPLDETFDIALVDSPKGYAAARKIHPGQEDCSRFNTCILALKYAPVVLLHDAIRPLERGSLGRLSSLGHKVTMLDSAYGMARIERDGKNPNRLGATRAEELGSLAAG